MLQLVEQLEGHATCTSLESYRQVNSMMGAALQHVQAMNASHWIGTVADGDGDGDAFLAADFMAEATSSGDLHKAHMGFSNAGMPQHVDQQEDKQWPEHSTPIEHAKASQIFSAEVERITENELSTSDTQENVVHNHDPDANRYSTNHSNGQAAFQTQHSQVQSQLAGLRRRAARKSAV